MECERVEIVVDQVVVDYAIMFECVLSVRMLWLREREEMSKQSERDEVRIVNNNSRYLSSLM